MDLHNVVLSDSLVTDNGWFLHPVDVSKERFKLQKVTYTENAGISNWGEVIDVTDKIQFSSDYKSWTLPLGDIGTQGYMLFINSPLLFYLRKPTAFRRWEEHCKFMIINPDFQCIFV